MLPSIMVYGGLLAAVIGAFCLVQRIRARLGLGRRSLALVLVFAGLAVACAGLMSPAPAARITLPRSRLDEFAPAYQFREFHSIQVGTPCENAYRAVQEVTPQEIHFLHALTWLRRGGRPGPESVLNPPPNTPMLEVMLRSGFLLLAEDPGQEVVLGAVVIAPAGWQPSRYTPQAYKELRAPGFALASANFLLEADGPSACTVSTETRIWATDDSARRKFAHYWRLIYPGSALIRRMWLRAIRTRAEGGLPSRGN